MARGLVIGFHDIDCDTIMRYCERGKANILYNDKLYPAKGVRFHYEDTEEALKVVLTEEFNSDKIFIEVPEDIWGIECLMCKVRGKCESYRVYPNSVTLDEIKNPKCKDYEYRELVCINDCSSKLLRQYVHEVLTSAVNSVKEISDDNDKVEPCATEPKVVTGDLRKLYDKAAEFNIPENVLDHYSKRLTELCRNMDANDSIKSVFTEHFINGVGAFSIAKKMNTDTGKTKKLIDRSVVAACIYMESLHPKLLVHIDKNTLLCDIGLPSSVCKSIDETNLNTLGDIAELYKDDILSIPKIGKATVQKLIEVLEYGNIPHNLDKDKPIPADDDIEDEVEELIAEVPEEEEQAIDWEEKYNNLLNQFEIQQEVISNQSRQIQLLQNRVLYKDKTYSTLPIKLDMEELFEDELRYNILNIVNFYYKANKDNLGASRVMDIVKAIMEQNPVDDIRSDLKQKLSEAMPDGVFKNNITPGMLSAIGFDYDKNGDGHYYVYPKGHKEYGHSIAATPSDFRTGDNQTRNIVNIIFGR